MCLLIKNIDLLILHQLYDDNQHKDSADPPLTAIGLILLVIRAGLEPDTVLDGIDNLTSFKLGIRVPFPHYAHLIKKEEGGIQPTVTAFMACSH